MTPVQLNELIKNRRAIFPATYIDRPIPRAIIEQVLENANWAPTHKFTEPWRFKIFTGKALTRLGEALAAIYKEVTPPEKFKEKKFEKIPKKTQKSGCIIAICMQRDLDESVPEWEEIAAIGAAVQNMWLTCTSYAIGSYWSSPAYIKSEALKKFLGLELGQRCLGFFYMGYSEMPQIEGKRKPIAEKIEWLEE